MDIMIQIYLQIEMFVLNTIHQDIVAITKIKIILLNSKVVPCECSCVHLCIKLISHCDVQYTFSFVKDN